MPGPAFLQRYRNDPAVRTGLTVSSPQNGDQAERDHERHAESDAGVGLLVGPEGEDDPVGKIVLFDIDETHGTGELACWVVPDEHGNGYATEATRLMLATPSTSGAWRNSRPRCR